MIAAYLRNDLEADANTAGYVGEPPQNPRPAPFGDPPKSA
jgi:hypothetical protein